MVDLFNQLIYQTVLSIQGKGIQHDTQREVSISFLQLFPVLARTGGNAAPHGQPVPGMQARNEIDIGMSKISKRTSEVPYEADASKLAC